MSTDNNARQALERIAGMDPEGKRADDLGRAAGIARAALVAAAPAMNPWVPTTNLLELRRLGKTVEELGELVSVLGRSICQGMDGIDPASGQNNMERMLNESADVLAQIGCNVLAFAMDQEAMEARVARKSRKMGEWESLFTTPGNVLPGNGGQGGAR